METRLEAAGAQRPAAVALPPGVPLRLLDTPANRRLASALRVAYDAWLEVDRERFGQDIGTDGEAQMLEMLLADKEMEIYGPEILGRGVNLEQAQAFSRHRDTGAGIVYDDDRSAGGDQS